MTVVSIHQPIYLPWLAYFDKIRRSDIHVVLDHVTCGKQDLCNRNKIRTPKGWEWLTIPIKDKGSRSTPISDIEIADMKWQQKHASLIRQNYSSAPCWRDHADYFKQLFMIRNDRLESYVYDSTLYLLDAFGISTATISSTGLRARGQKSDLNLNICKELGATKCLSGPFGRNYLDIRSFEDAGIEVEFTDFKHPVYQQCQPGDFIPGMSAIDAMLNGYRFP